MSSLRCVLLLCSLFFASCLGKDPWWLKIARKQGPMVCAQEYVQDSDRQFATPWTGGKLCESETIIRFSCCHGYGRVSGERGCPLVKPLKNLVETAEEFGAKKFMQQAEQSGLLPLLSDRGAYTLFIAPDSAFSSLTKEQEKALNNSKKSRSRPSVLLYTVAEGRVTAEDLPKALTTLYREGSVVVSQFPSGLTAVNCIPLIATNIEATNGLIHVTESLLLPPGRTTIPDILVRTPTLSTTAAAVVKAQLANELRDKRPITIFAPTDEAWQALPPSFTEALMEDTSSLKVLLQNHVVEGVWCPAITASSSEMTTLDGSTLTITCNSSAYYVNDAQIIHSDHKSGNGIVHHIDKVLIPEKVHSLAENLESLGMKYFMKMAETADLLPLMRRPDSYTVLVPDNDAFEALPNDTLSDILSQPSQARQLISLHIIPGRLLTTTIIDGQKLSSLNSGLPLRAKLHKKRLTVEDALATETNLESRNGVIHIIDRILTAPRLRVTEQLREGNFSIFTQLLNSTEPNLLKVLDNITSTFTVFAPSDVALNQTVPGLLQRLLADPPLLYKTMAHHIISTFVVSNSLEPLLTYSFTSIDNTTISVTKESDGSMTVARLAEVTEPDALGINGVVHGISRLIEL